jgi:hypothetical protein
MTQPDSDVIITRVTQTSMACPAQWDAWDDEGNYYYLRFRGGCGQMRQYTTADWVDVDYIANWKSDIPVPKQNPAFVREIAFFERVIPDDPDWMYDGDISLEEFAQRAGFTLALESHTSFGHHIRDELVTRGLVFLLDDEGKGNEE